MSSKAQRAAGKEKWVSGKNYKFDTPVKITRNQRGKRHLSIPSPWVHKKDGSQKASKTPLSKPKVSRSAKKQSEKKIKSFLQQEAKTKKNKAILEKLIIKESVVSLTPVDISRKKKNSQKGKFYESKNHDSDISKNDIDMDESQHEKSHKLSLLGDKNCISSEKLDSLTLADKIATILNDQANTRKGIHSKTLKDETLHAKSKKRNYQDLSEGKVAISTSLNNGNQDKFFDAVEKISTEKEKLDVGNSSVASEEKPKRSWCSIA